MGGFGNNCISNNTVCTHYIDNNCQDTNKQKHGCTCNNKTKHGCCCDTTDLKCILMEFMKKQVPIWWVVTQAKVFPSNSLLEQYLYVINICDNIAYFSLGLGQPTKYIIPLSNISWIFAFDETNRYINLKEIIITPKLDKDSCCPSPEIAKEAKEYFKYFGGFLPYININIKAIGINDFGDWIILVLLFLAIAFFGEYSTKLLINNDITIAFLYSSTEVGFAYSIVPICAIDSFNVFTADSTTTSKSLNFNINTQSILENIDLESLRKQIQGKSLSEIIEIVKQLV